MVRNVRGRKIHAERTARHIYAQRSSPFLLVYEKHSNYLGRAFENTCAKVKNKNLVCAKNQETHADNSKTGIRYVQKSWKHMRIIQKLESGMCKKARNTCGQFKNWNLVCAKKLETHADNSKTGIRYVQKRWKHMRTIQKQELGMYNKSDNTYL